MKSLIVNPLCTEKPSLSLKLPAFPLMLIFFSEILANISMCIEFPAIQPGSLHYPLQPSDGA